MNDLIKMVVGFDQKESIVYHTFVQSIIDTSSSPVSFFPLVLKTLNSYKETHLDKSNEFIYSRFLTPYINNFEGWAIFADGDMICQSDITELWNLRDDRKALQVVKHNYKTKMQKKYLGNLNENYPKKNWSSLVLWNCSHPKHKILTPDFISSQSGKYLHRFSWLEEEDIGELPMDWNWLAIEYPENYDAKLIHFTLGAPCFKEFKNTEMSDIWFKTYNRTIEGFV